MSHHFRSLIVLASFVALVPVASADGATVSGTITYRERIALPPAAVVEVTLEDVSRADAPSEVLARMRLSAAGQVPIPFELSYDPNRINPRSRYAVRARILDGERVLFASTGTFLVLTQGRGDTVSLVLQRGPGFSETGVAEPRPAPSVPARPLPPVVELRNLPATFAGTLPCDGCPARRYELNLYPDDTFFVRTTPLARGANVDDDLGSWVLSSDRRVIVLKRASGATEHFAIRDNSTLRKLDERGREISGTQQDLRRTAAFRPLAARLTVSGAYARTGDVRRLIECSTGQTWNVAGESPLGAMPSAPQGRAGNAVGTFLTATGRLEAPGAGSDAAPVFAIERIEPSTTDACPIRFAGLPLSGTYWRLTDLGATSIRTPAGARNEPAITFRAESRTFSGTGGCNRLAGRYESGPDALAMVAAGTMMACTTGGEHETAFARALTATRRYRILGTSLELFDDQGRAIARFEGRP